MATLHLNCLIEGEAVVFTVTAACDATVNKLKEFIQSKRALGSLKDIDPHSLELWKPQDSNGKPITAKPRDTLLERIRGGLSVELDAEDSVFDIFLTQPPRDCIHIIVKVPHITSLTTPLPQPPLIRRTSGSDPPVISPHLSLRKRTVEGLYDAMMEERLIYVRGTPGSGKSTLLDLLHQHILQKDPEALVCVTVSWPPLNFTHLPENNSYAWLQTIIPGFPTRTSRAFLLMDEGQETFRDSFLWHMFLKNIIDKPSCYRVVIFCYYGSPSTPGGMPTDLKTAARMTLWPRKVKEGVTRNGLLLDWDEFNEVVLQFNDELAIDLDLSQKIFELTAGHAGATKTHIGPLTLDTFYKEFSLDYIMDNLAGAFTRGLPKTKELRHRPDVSRVLRLLLISGRVTESSDVAAIQYCHRKGWIYAEDILEGGPQSYTLASPLHHAALSWRLEARNDIPQFKSPYALSLQVLANFKPSQMELHQ